MHNDKDAADQQPSQPVQPKEIPRADRIADDMRKGSYVGPDESLSPNPSPSQMMTPRPIKPVAPPVAPPASEGAQGASGTSDKE